MTLEQALTLIQDLYADSPELAMLLMVTALESITVDDDQAEIAAEGRK